MSKSDLASLTITNLRGYVQPFSLDFDRNKKLCIVYGQNGTGKSTLCDALDLLSTDNLGSLDDRGLGKTDRYIAPLGHAVESTIELSTIGQAAYTARIKAGRVSRPTSTAKPQVRVLRRSQVLKIVNAKASERYAEIKGLVDVSGIETSEQALAQLVKDTERDAEGRVKRLAGAKAILEELFNVAAAAGDPIAWARKEAAVDSTTARAAAPELEGLKTAYESLTRRAQTISRAIDTAKSASKTADEAESTLVNLQRGDDNADTDEVALLESASRLLRKHDSEESCPLCESTVDVADLRERVARRLDKMSTLKSAMVGASDAKRKMEQANQALATEQKSYQSECGKFQDAYDKRGFSTDQAASMESPPNDAAHLSKWLTQTASAYEAIVLRCDELRTRVHNLERMRNALKTYDEDHQLAERATKLLKIVRTAHDCVRKERHSFVNGILEQISQEVGRLYEQVHPGEGLGKINIGLEPNKKASLDLSTSFLTAPAVPPQAYLSDSHLDTLGVCVFIALAKMRDASSAILVLDDVLASVDEPHIDRMVEMIYQEAQDFRHVLITTHYRPWREKLRWGWLKNGQCQVVELGRWTPNGGPTLVRSTAEIERLRTLVIASDFDAQAACGKAGVVLEALLDFLTELYQCRLPRKSRNDWTLGDLLPALGKKLRPALRVEHQDPTNPETYISHDLNPVIAELERVMQARNLFGAHFNRLSFELLDSDAENFAAKVLELADLIVHPEHGWPRNDKSGSYWATAKDARRLHPLKEPT